jgi:hypothetical protein
MMQLLVSLVQLDHFRKRLVVLLALFVPLDITNLETIKAVAYPVLQELS